MTKPPSPKHVFMSYSRRDEAVMQRISIFLRKQGINIWVDNEKLVPGTPIWEEEIEKAINTASAVVVVMSPDSKNSEWVRREISLAEKSLKRIFPILVQGDEDSSITLRLITRQYVDFRNNEKQGLALLHRALAGYLDDLELQFEEKTDNNTDNNKLKITADKQVAENRSYDDKKKKISPLHNRWAIFRITVGWAISGAISGYLFSDYGEIAGGLVGGAVGGLAMSIALRSENGLSNQNNIAWITLGWAIGGVVGWLIGWVLLTEAIGAGVGMAILAIIGLAGTQKIGYFRSNGINVAGILLAWAIGGAIGWSIAKEMIDNYSIDIATGWAIGTAIGWAIAGFVMGWQLLNEKGSR